MSNIFHNDLWISCNYVSGKILVSFMLHEKLLMKAVLDFLVCFSLLNPLHPNINMSILNTILNTFPKMLMRRISCLFLNNKELL